MLGDLGRALGQLWDPRFWGVLVRALLLTVALLVGAAWAVLSGLSWLLPESLALPFIGTVGLNAPVISWAAAALVLLASAFLMLPVAFVCVGFFLDAVADAVEARHYPHLPPATPMSLGRAMGEALSLLLLVVVANGLALVVYLISTVAAPFVFWAVNGYLLGREYFQLVAERRLAPAAARALRRRHRGQVWGLGVLLAIPLSIPGLNLFVPIVGVAAYTHMAHRLGAP